MEISKKNIFRTEYISILGQVKEKKKESKLLRFIKENKLISITFFMFCIGLSLNIFLIYNFMKIIAIYK